ncbi:hypothetical protein KPH14_011165 [Odynerus spinipes]|uniref:Uncharacterized protein n=1 Tax=Odynerus spinipes TaxID=1348599 RepID=A0AAD9RFY0_9HYME|nr:hypothetical protein KPH14_011165 [Odynerus spinipes]
MPRKVGMRPTNGLKPCNAIRSRAVVQHLNKSGHSRRLTKVMRKTMSSAKDDDANPKSFFFRDCEVTEEDVVVNKACKAQLEIIVV